MHLQTEVGIMCNNIKNLNAENLKSANQQISKSKSLWTTVEIKTCKKGDSYHFLL